MSEGLRGRGRLLEADQSVVPKERVLIGAGVIEK